MSDNSNTLTQEEIDEFCRLYNKIWDIQQRQQSSYGDNLLTGIKVYGDKVVNEFRNRFTEEHSLGADVRPYPSPPPEQKFEFKNSEGETVQWKWGKDENDYQR